MPRYDNSWETEAYTLNGEQLPQPSEYEFQNLNYTYNAVGERVIKDGNAVQFSINQNFTQRAGSSFKHVFVGTQRLVTKRAEADNHREPLQWFYHTDHLQSTSYLTNSRGDLEEYLAYFPYGETWVEEHPSMPIDYQFSAKELDPETGYYYFGARYYDPRVSVWVSTDPALGEYLPTAKRLTDKEQPFEPEELPSLGGVYNSQNLNVFVYAGLNPLRYFDPDGRILKVAGSTQFVNRVNAQLDALRETPTGQAMVSQLEASPNLFLVVENANTNPKKIGSRAIANDYSKAQNGKGSGAVILHDSKWTPKVKTSKGDKARVC
ncbi:MAG: hypothetical protein LDLANPLL_02917 [Turneriella sp.]|nr:hypothetical protein [Turneriella sp.]